MIIVGLTGSIGMGKSTTAKLFAEEGAAVFDADAAVAALYAPGGAAVQGVADAFPGCASVETGVDRAALSAALQADPSGFARLEAIVHPLVEAERQAFFARARAEGRTVVVLDVPLLFETGQEDRVHTVVVVSAPHDVQRERVLSRQGMSEAKLKAILARQMDDSLKRGRADFVIDTSQGLDAARLQVRAVMNALTGDQS
ncbi:dephospho-CoA kinase [Alkalicaulis satelles]|uniref:Dephospho-CoA kinase n=1 Tax=Alkalicaulis satelles TaxID=2609175 RepID=A0A5M6ZHQ6_9PROT|nr:dephospho-CoA kinase [Alkalicaulis satelles]KAA5803830.1 dephospho-CoA kinase [Alkalicaulis satelles]